jgi:hypothetical protein
VEERRNHILARQQYLRENRIRCGIRMHDENTINHEEMTIIVQARHIIDA